MAVFAAWALVWSLAGVCATSQGPSFAVSADVQACIVLLTSKGAMAAFDASLKYEVRTNTSGRLVMLKELNPAQIESAAPYMQVKAVRDGIRRWTIEPAGRYSVTVHTATTGASTTYTVCVYGTSDCRKVEPRTPCPEHAK